LQPRFKIEVIDEEISPNTSSVASNTESCEMCSYSSTNKLEVLYHIGYYFFIDSLTFSIFDLITFFCFRTVHCNEIFSDPALGSGSFERKISFSKSGKEKNRPHACDACGSAFTQKIHLVWTLKLESFIRLNEMIWKRQQFFVNKIKQKNKGKIS